MTVEIKEIVDDYLLLCYDIPASAMKERKQFLRQALSVGALMFTSSVYLLPYSSTSMALAEKLAKVGSAVIWRSKQENPQIAKAITIKYDEHIRERVAYIMARFVSIKMHIEEGRLGIADKMIAKTHDLIEQLKTISESYHPIWLDSSISLLEKNLSQVYDVK